MTTACLISGVDHLGSHYLRRRSSRLSLSPASIISSIIISGAAHLHRHHHHFNHLRFHSVIELSENRVNAGSVPIPVSGSSDQFLILPETSCRGNYQR
ncbi:hypothetical protein F2Q70_00010423 [Brassica cretica]|uniref:Uncharacterized protein n=1 Tax=Brassica cretica TaxID=69181 RepID=A0A8S9M9P8_BRACR|nr:hypothetical protein F2Q70_00010423 [Brassica cretica]